MKIKTAYVPFSAFLSSVERMQLTGHPFMEDLFRCAELLYIDGCKAISHLYNVIRNQAYHVRQPVPFCDSFKYLDAETDTPRAESVNF